MTAAYVLLACLALLTGALLLARDARLALVLVFGVAFIAAALAWTDVATTSRSVSPGNALVLLIVDGVAALTASLILLGSVWPPNRPERAGQGWQGLLAAVRTPRYPTRLQLLQLALAGLVTWLLTASYGLSGRPSSYAWTLLLVSALLLLAAADTLPAAGAALLTLAAGLRVLYVVTVQRIILIELVLFDLLPIVLALVIAHLCAVAAARTTAIEGDEALNPSVLIEGGEAQRGIRQATVETEPAGHEVPRERAVPDMAGR